jgi:tetratricopeptide (TPR) repeat protein
VTGRTSAFSFKGRNEDLRTIAEKLGVGHLLEGTVRKSGDRVRIDIQLVEAADGFRVWTQSYDRALDDMIAVQDDIARSVARKLHVTLLATEAQTPRPSAAAYDLVLRARFALQNPTAEGIEQARGILERALALAPDYAPAWAEMGLLHFREYEVVNTHADRQRATEDALKALTRALELDRNLAAAHARMATVHRRVWAFEQAQASITRALALEPGNPIVVGSAAFLYYVLGRSDEAIAHYQHLLRIDPLLPVGYWFLSESYILAGRLDEAMAPLNALRELTPDYWQACITEGNIHLLRGEAEQARAAFARLRALHPTGDDDVVFHRAIVDHTAGDSASSTAAAADFEARWGREDPFRCAEIRGWRGETDAAFEWLERAFAVRDPVLHTVRTDVYLRPLHADPRWNALLDRIGLPSD